MKNVKNIINVIIVEDEIHAQKELCRLLEKSSFNVNILEIIDSVEDAIEWIELNPPPDLMFFDIQLSDGLSFEILQNAGSPSPVIFTTAYDEYAIRAFKVNSIDYLLKPIKENELESALAKYHKLKTSQNKDINIDFDAIAKIISSKTKEYKKRFIAKLGDQIMHISTEEISYFKAEDNEVLVVTKNNNKYFVDYTLDQVISLVDPESFHRINRSYVTHISSVKKINKYFNSRLTVNLHPSANETVIISRVKVPDFLKWIDK